MIVLFTWGSLAYVAGFAWTFGFVNNATRGPRPRGFWWSLWIPISPLVCALGWPLFLLVAIVYNIVKREG